MFPGLILMMAAGVAFAMGASDPTRVTLRWLRLGGIVGGSLLGVVGVVCWTTREGRWLVWTGLGLTTAAIATQLATAQLARARVQRGAAAIWFLLATGTVLAMFGALPPSPHDQTPPAAWQVFAGGVPDFAITASIALSSILLGACLMAMLLGHAYLTAGNEMTQQPFRRLVRILFLALAIRALLSGGTACFPWIRALEGQSPPIWTGMTVIARYAVGILVPGVFLYMVHDCVKHAANQSATGILYVTLVLIIIGEGSALSLMLTTALPF